MFTGIIENTGLIKRISSQAGLHRLTIQPVHRWKNIHSGESLSVDGVCLTITSNTHQGLTVDVMSVTWKRTIVHDYTVGQCVNLERPLRYGQELGGHIVTGHVDCLGRIQKLQRGQGNYALDITLPEALARHAVPRGSVAVNGVSLTIAAVKGRTLTVALIPFTLHHTNLSLLHVGDPVNVETDIIAKYLRV